MTPLQFSQKPPKEVEPGESQSQPTLRIADVLPFSKSAKPVSVPPSGFFCPPPKIITMVVILKARQS